MKADNKDLIPVSDFFKLAVLDLLHLTPRRTEHNGRYWAYFDRGSAQKLLDQYDSGVLRGCLRDYAASIERVKTRIFESERMARNGANHGSQSRR